MAQLKDTTLTGDLRVTGALTSTTGQFDTIKAPSQNDISYTVGTNGQVLLSNGTNSYWGDLPSSASAMIKNEAGNAAELQHAEAINDVPDLTLRPMISSVRANRLIFLPASAIIIEKTTDGGTTWESAGISDTAKREVFADIQNGIALPLLNSKQNKLCGLRFIITAMVYNVPANTAESDKYTYWNSSYITDRQRYCTLYGLYFWVSTKSNDNGITVKVEAATGAQPNTWVTLCEPDPTKYTLTGWSGGNFITFPESFFGGYVAQTDRYWNYKITFMSHEQVGKTFNTNVSSAPSIVNIAGYGNSYYYGNDMMKYDHIYHYDVNQNAFFPGKVEANRFTGAGTNLTALNASNISSGTLNVARLPSDIQGTLSRLTTLQTQVAQIRQQLGMT